MFAKLSTSVLAASVMAAILIAPGTASAKDGKNAALLGGLAAGTVGGVLLGKALQDDQAQAQPAPQPVYEQPAPPQPVYRPPPQPAPVAYDPDMDQLARLHDGCDNGSRRACIQFGIMIGQHREREAQWRRSHPDYFQWDSY
jgi:hypothetical protein